MSRMRFLSFLGMAAIGLGVAGLGGVAADHDNGNGKSQDGKGKKNQVWCLVSDTNVLGDADDFSGVAANDGPLQDLTFGEITTLSTDFYVKEGDCGGGSPRFQISLDTDHDGDHDGNVFVYLGPWPNYNGCPLQTWESSGNLVTNPELRWDTTQVGGTFYGSHAQAVILVGGADVLGVSLAVDSGWVLPSKRQVICVDDAEVNGVKLNKGFGGATQTKLK
jgi:hypothetical protein